MKESISFSTEETEKTSLNFFELREKGLAYIQELSGENWTDFNSHDPGVTILEQLCYALTDASLRSSNSMRDLLTPKRTKKDEIAKGVDATKNAFYAPSEINRTHPVTIFDTRKVIIDHFVDIHNIWIKTTDNSSLAEKLVVTERIDVLSKFTIPRKSEKGKNVMYSKNEQEKEEWKLRNFISKHRNLGEDVEIICFLKPKYVDFNIEIHFVPENNIEEILANCVLALFEYIYTPVSQHTSREMLDDGYTITEIRTGPKMKNGLIKDDDLRDRRVKISRREIENSLSLVENIYKCNVTSLKFKDDKEDKKELKVSEDEFFHLFDAKSSNFQKEDIKYLFEKFIELKVNDEKYNHFGIYDNIYYLFYDKWSKKYGPYAMRDIQDYEFSKNLKGTNYGLEDYYSVQNHFPLVYGIGKEGLISAASSERKAKAKQFKGYLLFFEQYLANHLSQVSHLEDFFSIAKVGQQTYFSQTLNNDNVPNIESILSKSDNKPSHWSEDFFDRKDRIYSHLLARFGEDLNPTPLKVQHQKSISETDNELRDSLLNQKSNYLLKIDTLSAERNKGEVFVCDYGIHNDEKCDFNYKNVNSCENKRIKSGLEEIILTKTGIQPRNYRNTNQEERTNVDEEFYIVDHILLRDFINESEVENKVKYGFKIIDAEDKLICETKGEHFWDTKKERTNHFDELMNKLQDDDLYHMNDGITARLKTNIIGKLTTFKDDPKEVNKTRSRAEINELVNLFSFKETINARARVQELEKIRAKGVHEVARGEYGQRRLIFQRKISDLPIIDGIENIDEDFFNLSISIVLPNWSERFKNEQFRSYLADLIMERVPSHIRVNLCSVDKGAMNSFTTKYHIWENLKVKPVSDNSKESLNSLKKASYMVYTEIRKIHKANKDQAKKDRKDKLPRNRLNHIHNIII